MQQQEYPAYRRSINGLNWYRIDSATELTEVQRVGRRYVVHRMRALAYPEQVRIMTLLAMEDDHVEVCGAQEMEQVLAQAEGQGACG